MDNSAWQAYLQPNGTLKNLLGLTDEEELAATEYLMTTDRQRVIAKRHFVLPNGYQIRGESIDDVLQIHGFLFDGLYAWAGKYRNVDMMKGQTSFLEAQFIGVAQGELNRELAELATVRRGDKARLAHWLGQLISDFNYMHPFREGNGRTQRVWALALAYEKGFKFNLVPDQAMYDAYLQASIEDDAGMMQHVFEVYLEQLD
ncbi:Fic/DOC family protein [Lactiplantibacillus songbeiensis]|uniref:protein adenylyltransferase n=1 Tax=Lactiplantibacillus songbeiensis TaxID=2559920 RepID=A0ABW4C3A1_9LACO|nr:Fic family protein [Lactiplantibacillus songbeiensis]